MFEKEAEEIANKKLCSERICYNHCNFNSPKHHRCGEWHRIYDCAKESAEFGYNKAFVEADKNLKAIVTDFNKAKEIAKKFLEFVNNEVEFDSEHPQEHTDLWNELCEKAERFINEVEE